MIRSRGGFESYGWWGTTTTLDTVVTEVIVVVADNRAKPEGDVGRVDGSGCVNRSSFDGIDSSPLVFTAVTTKNQFVPPTIVAVADGWSDNGTCIKWVYRPGWSPQ